jgi:NAD(P)-dependent dehydrogenase (short-subunit alcohol dehydrogenase family)
VSLEGAGFVVTGGTGSLGVAVVRALLARGARVAVPYRGEAAFEALRTTSPREAPLFGLAADMARAEDAQRFIDAAAAELGRLDGVAAIAGAYAGSGPLESAPVAEWQGMLETNLATVYATCRAALPHLLKRGGSVVTVSSRTASTGGAGAAGYAVSKAAVLALTRVLALENAERGVRFNCVVPAVIDTAKNRAAMPKADATSWTSPDAIAAVVVFLLSGESSAVTGAVVPVDRRGS